MLLSGMSDGAPGETFNLDSESCSGVNIVISASAMTRWYKWSLLFFHG